MDKKRLCESNENNRQTDRQTDGKIEFNDSGNVFYLMISPGSIRLTVWCTASTWSLALTDTKIDTYTPIDDD